MILTIVGGNQGSYGKIENRIAHKFEGFVVRRYIAGRIFKDGVWAGIIGSMSKNA
jgi:hypothetical protein